MPFFFLRLPRLFAVGTACGMSCVVSSSTCISVSVSSLPRLVDSNVDPVGIASVGSEVGSFSESDAGSGSGSLMVSEPCWLVGTSSDTRAGSETGAGAGSVG